MSFWNRLKPDILDLSFRLSHAIQAFQGADPKVDSSKKLALEKAKLETLVSKSELAIGLMSGPDLVFELVNKKWTELVSPREYIGRRYADIYPELVGTAAHQSLVDIFKTGKPFVAHEMKLKVTSPAGVLEDQYFDYSNFRVMDPISGQPYGVYCSALNVTEKVIARQLVESAAAAIQEAADIADRERAKFEAAFHAVAEGIFIFDSNGNPVFMNDAAAKVFGSAVAADVRKRFEYYFERLDLYELDGTFIPLTEWPVAKALRGESFRDWQIQAHRTDTDDRWVWSSSGELAKQAGTDVTLAVVVLRDITDQKLAEDELRAAKLEAERANALKSSFLANMSHEIRTPLGAMVGFADLLRDPKLSQEEHNSYINVLTRNGEQLSEIINDILDLSKVEAGHLRLEYTDTDPKSIADDVVSLLEFKAKDRNLSLEFKADASTPKSLVTDSLRLRQILLNVVGNAVKFTQYGSIKIRSFGICAPGGGMISYFEVTDTGIGIAMADHEKIFEAFVQSDGTLARKFGGTGLGLALSRQLARKLGGDVSLLHSEEGKGSSFLIAIRDLPDLRTTESERREKQKIVEPEPNSLDGVHVLVVDDSADNKDLIKQFLKKYGAQVAFAENGLEGYKKALIENFDVVLMDIQMPVMDGYTATQKLREAGYRKPVIALTAHAMTEVRRKSLNVGCTDLLTKPINPKELVAAIVQYVH